MKLVGWWWNGRWGRMARRHIWLHTDGVVWRVEARQGDNDARVWGRNFDTEAEARQLVEAMMERTNAGEWNDLTSLRA